MELRNGRSGERASQHLRAAIGLFVVTGVNELAYRMTRSDPYDFTSDWSGNRRLEVHIDGNGVNRALLLIRELFAILPLMKLILFLAFVSVTACFAQSLANADSRELERLEKVWNDAHERGDATALESLWADDLEVAVPKMPVMTKTEVLNFARSGRMKFLHYTTSDLKFRVYGDAAVVTGRLERTRVLNGQEMHDDWRFTKTYVRQNERWRVVAFHASETAQP